MNTKAVNTPYAGCSDEDLVRLTQHHESDAIAVLITRYIPMINRCAYPFRQTMDFDDLVQEGSIGLLDAVSNFYPDKDVKFSTYAFACIRNRIAKAVEKSRSQKTSVLSQSISLEEVAEHSDGLTPEKIFINKESLQAVLEDVNRVLSPMERKILYFHLGGFDYHTIATSLQLPLKSVDNALQRVRRKLKAIHRA